MTLKSWLEVTERHLNWYHSKAWCGFIFAFHSNYGSLLHHFQDKATYWSKIECFIPLAFDAPLEGPRVEVLLFAIQFGVEKN